MAIQTMTLPSGRVLSYDDRYLPTKPGMKEIGMGLLGQATGPLLGLGTLYGASKLGLLGKGAADVGSALGAVGVEAAASNLGTIGQGGLETFGSELGEAAATGGSGVGFFGGNGLLGSGSMGTGAYIPGVLGLLGAYDMFSNQNRSRGISGLEGLASGTGIGFTLGGPIGAGIGAGVGGIAGLLSGGHKSTKERTKDRYDELAEKSNDQAYQDLVNAGRNISLSGRDTWQPGAGEAPVEILDYSYGVLNTFGPEWAAIEQAKRDKILAELAKNNLFNPEKGDYMITDAERAKQIRDQILGVNNTSTLAGAV